MSFKCRDAARLASSIEEWLTQKVHAAGAVGGIVGLSGGIDSAVVAALLKRAFGSDMLSVLLPCGSIPKDKEDALLAVKAFDLPYREVDLSPVYDAFVHAFGEPLSPMAAANIKPRLRMNALYALAQTRRFLNNQRRRVRPFRVPIPAARRRFAFRGDKAPPKRGLGEQDRFLIFLRCIFSQSLT